MNAHVSYTPEEQKANRDKWVAALRSGEFEQGRGRLRDGEKFCCLGVACELAAREGVVDYSNRLGGSYEGLESVPPVEVQVWLGLIDECGETRQGREYDNGEYAASLTELNDGAGWTFADIAALIEADGIKLAGDSA